MKAWKNNAKYLIKKSKPLMINGQIKNALTIYS
jgi:hypothetical protein